MTTGEKRSVTNSLKKAAELFLEKKNDFSAFSSKDDFIGQFYAFWINYSIDSRLSWCFDKKNGAKEYHLKNEFRGETEEKIREIFADKLAEIIDRKNQLSSIHEVAKKLPPLRSKKKRMRKKWEKKLQAI